MRFGFADGARRGPNSRDSLRRKSFIKRTGASYCASRFRSAMSASILIASFAMASEAPRMCCDGSRSWSFAAAIGNGRLRIQRIRYGCLVSEAICRTSETRSVRCRGARGGAQERVTVGRNLPFASGAFSRPEANRDSAAATGPGSIVRYSREKASWLGSPCFWGIDRHRIASLMTAKSAVSTQVCPPHRLESSEIIGISRKSRRAALLVRDP